MADGVVGFQVITSGVFDFDCEGHYTCDVGSGSNWTTTVTGDSKLDTTGTTKILSDGKMTIKSSDDDIDIEADTVSVTSRVNTIEVVHKNSDKRVIGNDFSFRFGATESIMVGNKFGLFLGLSEDINVSASLALKLAAESAFTLAAKFEMVGGQALGISLGQRIDLRVGTSMSVRSGLDIAIDAGASKLELTMGVKMTADQVKMAQSQGSIDLDTIKAFL